MITREYESSIKLPPGWVVVNMEVLNPHRTMSHADTLAYFDGRDPVWADALSPDIPKRAIVGEMLNELTDSKGAGGARVTLLKGAGGEGKSTVLMQVVCALADRDSEWTVAWRRDTERTGLPPEDLLRLPRSGRTYLFASDDGDLMASAVFKAVKALNEAGRRDVQFLLCSRDVDWRSAKANLHPWETTATAFVERRMRGFSDERDAEDIVRAWSKYGDAGMGKLKNKTHGQAVSLLIEAASSEEDDREGAFLGAMLQTRFGEGLRGHVKKLLSRLDEKGAPGGTLMTAFSNIAALHAEKFYILSKPVLADVLGCDVGAVKREVLGPLKEELAAREVAAETTSGTIILTRHRVIAETAKAILDVEFDLDFDELYVKLVESARRLRRSDIFVPELRDWHHLSRHFYNTDRKPLGLRLTRLMVESDPTDLFFINQLAGMLRETGAQRESVALYREFPQIEHERRSFFFEWSTSEKSNGNYGLAVWLAGVALADGTATNPLNAERAIYCLNALAHDFGKLFDKHGDPLFIGASGAAAQLGLMLPVTTKTDEGERLLRGNQLKSREAGIEDVAPEIALERLQTGIVGAWHKRETVNPPAPPWLKKAEDLTFNGLKRLVGVAVDVPSAASTTRIVPLVKRQQAGESVQNRLEPLQIDASDGEQTHH